MKGLIKRTLAAAALLTATVAAVLATPTQDGKGRSRDVTAASRCIPRRPLAKAQTLKWLWATLFFWRERTARLLVETDHVSCRVAESRGYLGGVSADRLNKFATVGDDSING